MNIPSWSSSSSSSDDEAVEFFIHAVIAAAQIILEVEEEEEEQSTTPETTTQNREPTNNILIRHRQPELPEVEAARRAIADNCIGKKIIRSVVADDADVIHRVSRSVFEASLVGKTIVGAYRKGKNMWIQLDSPPFPSFQFGMAGAIYIKGVDLTKYRRSAVRDTDEWPFECSKLFIELDNGLELSFIDKSRSAKVRLLENPATEAPISELGPDAFMEPMTEDELFEALSKKKIAIKRLLLDQSFISGVGDWIADEVLYQAKIHPLQLAASIPKEGSAALHKSLKEVIQHSVEVDADWRHFPVDWLFRYRWGKKPGKINGKTIKFINAGGRTTAYVHEVQKLTRDQAVKAAVKPQRKFCNRTNDEAESEGEEIAKPKGGNKITQSGAKKPPAKRKPDTSDDDDTSDDSNNDDDTSDDSNNDDDTSDDYDDDNRKRPAPKDSPGNKKSPTRKKLKGNDSDGDSDNGDEDDNEGERGGC